MNLYHILLETPLRTYSSEVGAETTAEAIDMLYDWLIGKGVDDEHITERLAHYSGDRIGKIEYEGVLVDDVHVTDSSLGVRYVPFSKWIGLL